MVETRLPDQRGVKDPAVEGTSHRPLPRPVVLLIDDEVDLVAMAGNYLTRSGFEVLTAGDTRTGAAQLRERPVDLVVLDLGLPDGNGLELLRTLRQDDHPVPVVVLSGRGLEGDRLLGLELGADDYIVKPFSLPELAARIRAVLRRSAPPSAGPLVPVGELVIDTSAHEVSVHGTPLALRPLEYDLLTLLALSPRQVHSTAQLLEQVWGSAAGRADATVSEHVYRIRQKLTHAGAASPRIVTVRGVGYRLDP
ncbi:MULTISPECIES: response regulator transcription factor [unclassified Blastococcus]